MSWGRSRGLAWEPWTGPPSDVGLQARAGSEASETNLKPRRGKSRVRPCPGLHKRGQSLSTPPTNKAHRRLESGFTTLIEYSNYSVQIENTVFSYKCIISKAEHAPGLVTVWTWCSPAAGDRRHTLGTPTRQPRIGHSEPRAFTRRMWRRKRSWEASETDVPQRAEATSHAAHKPVCNAEGRVACVPEATPPAAAGHGGERGAFHPGLVTGTDATSAGQPVTGRVSETRRTSARSRLSPYSTQNK